MLAMQLSLSGVIALLPDRTFWIDLTDGQARDAARGERQRAPAIGTG
jgi:hypothetical protein